MAGRALEHRPWRVRPLVFINHRIPDARSACQAVVVNERSAIPRSVSAPFGSRTSVGRSSPGHGTCPHQISSHSHVSVCPRHSDRSSHIHVLFYLLTASSVYSALLRFSPDVFLPSPRGARYILPMTWAIWRLVISSTKRQISLRSCACATSAS